MPEGDTVHRIAARLRSALAGRPLDRVWLRDRGDVEELTGRTVTAVEARGKHLMVHLEGGWSLRVHLGMHGRWSRLHAAQRWPARTTAALVSGSAVYLCERAYTAEPLRTATLRSHPRLARLGPDLLADPPDIGEAVRRARHPALAEREIGDVLLDQRIAAGIGNIWKSETLFAARVDPRTRVSDLDPDDLARIYDTAARLLRLNLRTGRPTSIPLRARPLPSSPRLRVYRRAGRPCLECGSPIEWFRQGDTARATYFCPACQGGANPDTGTERARLGA